MPAYSQIELKDLKIAVRIGTYGPDDVVREAHLLDLTLTIAPDLLDALDGAHGDVPRRLHPRPADAAACVPVDEAAFARALGADAMAGSKLADGIAGFTADLEATRSSVAARLRG